MKKATNEGDIGVEWTIGSKLSDLDFADDIALLAKEAKGLQQLTSNLEVAAGKFRLRICSEKTKVMYAGIGRRTSVKVGDEPVGEVTQFTYLGGGVIANNGDVATDAKIRIGKAAAVFRKMNSIWTSTSINVNLKIRLYNPIVLPTVLYSSEVWKSTVSLNKKLDVFHQRCLWKILKTSYRNRITNDEVLRRAKSKPLHDTVITSRIKLAGHILRLPAERHSKTAQNRLEKHPSEGITD